MYVKYLLLVNADFCSGTTRMLFHVAVRSCCEGSEERLFLEEPVDNFVSEMELSDTSPEFTKQYLAAFRENLPEDESKAVLQDRLDTGWLAWGKRMEVTRLSAWEEQAWKIDPTSRDGMQIFEHALSIAGWWQQVRIPVQRYQLTLVKVADHWAQEDTRNYPSATHIDFVLSLSQLFGKPVLEGIKPIVEAYLAEMESTKVYDRHKMRALWELLSGLLRGSEEWAGKDRAEFWSWLTTKLPELFANIRHDTTKSVVSACCICSCTLTWH